MSSSEGTTSDVMRPDFLGQNGIHFMVEAPLIDTQRVSPIDAVRTAFITPLHAGEETYPVLERVYHKVNNLTQQSLLFDQWYFIDVGDKRTLMGAVRTGEGKAKYYIVDTWRTPEAMTHPSRDTLQQPEHFPWFTRRHKHARRRA